MTWTIEVFIGLVAGFVIGLLVGLLIGWIVGGDFAAKDTEERMLMGHRRHHEN